MLQQQLYRTCSQITFLPFLWISHYPLCFLVWSAATAKQTAWWEPGDSSVHRALFRHYFLQRVLSERALTQGFWGFKTTVFLLKCLGKPAIVGAGSAWSVVCILLTGAAQAPRLRRDALTNHLRCLFFVLGENSYLHVIFHNSYSSVIPFPLRSV